MAWRKSSSKRRSRDIHGREEGGKERNVVLVLALQRQTQITAMGQDQAGVNATVSVLALLENGASKYPK